MATEAEESGFLSRWSRRKTLQREGAARAETASPVPVAAAAVAEPATTATEPATAALTADQRWPSAAGSPARLQPTGPVPQPPPAPTEPAPSLADVALLTRESDFARFVGPGVQPEVKNAALAKLFTDPHFNVMDRLDVYIDDYGKPDPLPPGMLRQMLQAHTLGLFDDDEKDDPKLASPPTTPAPTPTPAPADAAAPPPPPEPAPDEDTDLQLQPDDGAGRPGPETGAGEDAGQPH